MISLVDWSSSMIRNCTALSWSEVAVLGSKSSSLKNRNHNFQSFVASRILHAWVFHMAQKLAANFKNNIFRSQFMHYRIWMFSSTICELLASSKNEEKKYKADFASEDKFLSECTLYILVHPINRSRMLF